MSRPTITFSLSPLSSSTLPLMAASVSTRVVSWKDAAEMKLSVESDALVMPSSTGCAVAGRFPPATALSFSSEKTNLSTSSPTTNSVSPTSSMRTRRSIWRTMISMCLSLIVTPCRR